MAKRGQFEARFPAISPESKGPPAPKRASATLKDRDDQGVRLHLIGTLALNGNLHYYRFCHVDAAFGDLKRIFQILEFFRIDPTEYYIKPYVPVFTIRRWFTCGRITVRLLGRELPKAVTP